MLLCFFKRQQGKYLCIYQIWFVRSWENLIIFYPDSSKNGKKYAYIVYKRKLGISVLNQFSSFRYYYPKKICSNLEFATLIIGRYIIRNAQILYIVWLLCTIRKWGQTYLQKWNVCRNEMRVQKCIIYLYHHLHCKYHSDGTWEWEYFEDWFIYYREKLVWKSFHFHFKTFKVSIYI